MVGADGVLRSFASNGTVLDFHQLDPTQLQEFAESQLQQWQTTGRAIPSAVSDLAKEPYIDGRQVLDKAKLLSPDDSPFPASSLSRRMSNWSGDVLPSLLGERQSCIGAPCVTVGQCVRYRPTQCYQCYFPGPPDPGGICLQP
ncbi:hypothetical protein F5Y16DRAFT_414581 [Xylariaceae sp. FL0255]|nr:hypothetical protein F5Y16DRAFT_414581 [Xylariaceae sp. FL0255]